MPEDLATNLVTAVASLQRIASDLSDMISNKGQMSEISVFRFESESEASPEYRLALHRIAKREYAERARRFRLLERDLLGEPAWDILLDLYIADFEGKLVSVTSSCIASNIPATTALRWIKILEVRGFVERQSDLTDARRVWVKLSDQGRSVMERILSERLE